MTRTTDLVAPPPSSLAVDLAEHDILCPDDGHDIREHVALAHEVQRLQVRKARGLDLATVRLVAAVRDEVHAELPLGRLHAGVGLALRHVVALREELEVVDEALHRLLHVGARGRRYLAVVRLDRARRHVLEALRDDAQRLPELLGAAQVTVVTIAVLADRDVKVEAVVAFVRLVLAEIPLVCQN